MRRAIDTLFALRPLHLIPALALYGAGAAWGRTGAAGAPAAGGGAALLSRTLPLLSLLALLAAVHAANSWRDREGDARNRKGAAVTLGLVDGRSLARAGGACAALAALLALLPPVMPSARALLVLAAALGAAYVTPGIALKERPGLDLAAHAVGYGVLAFLIGAASAGALGGESPEAWRRGLAAALPYAIGIGAVSVLTMIADVPGDEAAGQRTTATRLGPARSLDLASLLAWGTALSGLLAMEAVPALWGLVAATWLSLGATGAALTGEPAAEGAGGARGGRLDPIPISARVNRLAIQLQVAFLALLAFRAPWTGVAAIVLGAAVSAYDRWRFGFGYPLARLWGLEREGHRRAAGARGTDGHGRPGRV